jgi:alkaline phosphatase D
MKHVICCLFFSSILNAQHFRIAFGSCGHQDKSLSILENAALLKPDYFIFLGDNVYLDTRDTSVMRKEYDKLNANLSYKKLKAATKIIATWDDHDYGDDDAGKYYPMKKESKTIFLDFFEEPKNSERYKHDGIYTSYLIRKKCKRVQIILLDTRTFRSNLTRFEEGMRKDSIFNYDLQYIQQSNSDSTILGNEQWVWLESELQKKADVRIICSSTQFGISYNGYESWANFPKEQEKILSLLQKTKANGVFFISGDVHYAELSKLENQFTYPIYDLTASGLTQSWHLATPNKNRIAGPVMENHFGLLDFNLKRKKASLQIIDRDNQIRIDHVLDLKELKH